MKSTIIKITDKICYLGDKLTLNLNVGLLNGDSYFYNEFEYYYSQVNGLASSIKRSYQYYLSLDKINEDKSKSSIIIRIEDMFNFISCLDNVANVFKSEMFATNNNKLIMIKKPEPIGIILMGRDVTFLPTIISKESGDLIGILIEFDGTYSKVTLDAFMGMLYVLKKLDIYSAAQTLANSIKIDSENHKIRYDNDFQNNISRDIEAKTTNRKISSEKEKGFFNM